MGTRRINDYLESGEVDSIAFNKDAPFFPHKEGRLGYDKDEKTHISQNDIEESTLNIGFEQVIRVVNLTGSDIENGKAVRHDGVDPSSELPKIVLAQANSLVNARILGIATSTIIDGEIGRIATFGKVNDVPTGSFSTGVPVFLSDVTPGDYVETPPAIVTQVGGIIRSDPVNGILFAKIFNVIALPALFGLVQNIPDSYDLTTSYQNLVNYQSSDSVILVVDALAGTIQLPNAGLYRLTFNITMTVPTSPSTRSITVNVRNITQSVDEFSYAIPIPKDATEVSRSFSVPFNGVIAGDEIIMQIKSDTAIIGVTIDSVSFDIESISLTA